MSRRRPRRRGLALRGRFLCPAAGATHRRRRPIRGASVDLLLMRTVINRAVVTQGGFHGHSAPPRAPARVGHDTPTHDPTATPPPPPQCRRRHPPHPPTRHPDAAGPHRRPRRGRTRRPGHRARCRFTRPRWPPSSVTVSRHRARRLGGLHRADRLAGPAPRGWPWRSSPEPCSPPPARCCRPWCATAWPTPTCSASTRGHPPASPSWCSSFGRRQRPAVLGRRPGRSHRRGAARAAAGRRGQSARATAPGARRPRGRVRAQRGHQLSRVLQRLARGRPLGLFWLLGSLASVQPIALAAATVAAVLGLAALIVIAPMAMRSPRATTRPARPESTPNAPASG